MWGGEGWYGVGWCGVWVGVVFGRVGMVGMGWGGIYVPALGLPGHPLPPQVSSQISGVQGSGPSPMVWSPICPLVTSFLPLPPATHGQLGQHWDIAHACMRMHAHAYRLTITTYTYMHCAVVLLPPRPVPPPHPHTHRGGGM